MEVVVNNGCEFDGDRFCKIKIVDELFCIFGVVNIVVKIDDFLNWGKVVDVLKISYLEEVKIFVRIFFEVDIVCLEG